MILDEACDTEYSAGLQRIGQHLRLFSLFYFSAYYARERVISFLLSVIWFTLGNNLVTNTFLTKRKTSLPLGNRSPHETHSGDNSKSDLDQASG